MAILSGGGSGVAGRGETLTPGTAEESRAHCGVFARVAGLSGRSVGRRSSGLVRRMVLAWLGKELITGDGVEPCGRFWSE